MPLEAIKAETFHRDLSCGILPLTLGWMELTIANARLITYRINIHRA
jgi:hypothetical protein